MPEYNRGTTITDRQQFEGEDPLWHPSSWRIVTLSTGKSVKAGVGGGTRAKREAWLEAWERKVVEDATASQQQGQPSNQTGSNGRTGQAHGAQTRHPLR